MSRVALVTGGTRGIGAAIALELQRRNYRVASNYHGNDILATAFSHKTGIKIFKWDVSNFEECQEGVEQVRHALGDPEILINNAGIAHDSMLHKMEPKQWSEVIETNLTSCFYMTRAVIESMRKKEFGRIVNISSINGLRGQVGQTNYAAAKAGILGFTKALALEVASKGITVNAIAPGHIDTEMLTKIPPKVLEKIISQIPMKRLGHPEDIARTVAFLIADEAEFITGATFSINGGEYMA